MDEFNDIWDENALDETMSSNELLEDSFSSVVEKATPKSKKKSSGKQKQGSSMRRPPHDRIKCDRCGKTYANERTYSTHIKMHAMKDAASRFPDVSAIDLSIVDIVMDALDATAAEMRVGEMSSILKVHCQTLKSKITCEEGKDMLALLLQEYKQILSSQNFLFSSGLRSILNRGSNTLLSSAEFVSSMKAALYKIDNFENGVCNVFIGNFILQFSSKLLIFIIGKMRGKSSAEGGLSQKMKRSSDNVNSDNFRQVVYYIGGSIIHSYLKIASKYENCKKWTMLRETIKAKFLTTEPADPSDCADSSWTAAVDRGGLKYISTQAQSFFLKLVDLTMGHEEEDGSIQVDVVKTAVFNNVDILSKWDSLLGNEFSEELCVEYLMLFVTSTARVVSKGVIKRRINEIMKKSKSSVSLRHSLTR